MDITINRFDQEVEVQTDNSDREPTKEETIEQISSGFVFRYLETEDGEPFFKKEFLRINLENLKFYDVEAKKLIREWNWSHIQDIKPLSSHPLGFQIITLDGTCFKFLSECETLKERYLRLFPMFCPSLSEKNTSVSLSSLQNSTSQQELHFPKNQHSESQSQSSVCINDLPPEMLHTILSYVRDLPSLGVLCRTCKTWNNYISGDKYFGDFWRTMFYSRFAETQIGLKNPSWKNILKQRLIAESQRDNIPVAINPSRSIVQIGHSFQTWRVNVGIWGGKWYYEVKTVNCYVAIQIGFLGIPCKAKPWGLTMTGVGDDEFSYSYDPIRHCTFYKEIETKQYGTEVQWKNGDIVGCMIDLDKKKISFSLNGTYLGVAHQDVQIEHCPYFAGFSIYGDHSVADFHLKSSEMKYGPPPGYKAIGDAVPENSLLIEWIIGNAFLGNWTFNKERYVTDVRETRKNLINEIDTVWSSSSTKSEPSSQIQ